ncbi:glutathione S-transferase [Uruburuella testudinis]|uniref:Glutathione S-transferase n=1 Tax=Uruburuella testudinis TaxID=1282863 RepID=A0ABY4DSH5_9NEIS|nr:glutathione S-transferase [Uruburuella testudinis]UOO81848.1 glutathione S-transferase [Uruburuella testudinis]
MLTLHALAQSRSLRIVWLLELLGADYTLQQHERHPDTLLAPAALKNIHPLGKAPVLQDGDLILAESGAITDYLIQTYGGGRLMPAPGSADYWAYQRWLHYAEASLMPLMLMALVFRKIDSAPMPFFVKPVAKKISARARQSFIEPQTALHLRYVDHELAGRRWLMGDDISGADIMMSYPLQAAAVRFDVAAYPHISAYLQRIEEDEAYRRALTKAGSPMLAAV